MKKLQMSEKALTTTLCICAGVMVVTVVFLSAFAMVQSSRSKKTLFRKTTRRLRPTQVERRPNRV